MAGWAAACIAASPGLPIGVGGSPGGARVLYGSSLSSWRLGDRLGRRDVEPVSERRVDPERHPRLQPVVDTAATSARSFGTCTSPSIIDAMISTSYGGQVLLLRVGQVDLRPGALERVELQVHELARPSSSA